MRSQPNVWRILRAWTRRRPGMLMRITGTPEHNGIWIRPHFGDHPENINTWVNIATGKILTHFSYIPWDAKIREYGYPAPDSLNN